MKDLSLIIWLTQFALSVVSPLVGFILLAVWLYKDYGWGKWVLWVGIILAVICAVKGLKDSLDLMNKYGKRNEKKENPPVSFNEHD